MILCLQASAICDYSDNQTSSTHGFFKITGVLVNRINLALKEIDIEIAIADVEIDGPFNITVWAPFHGRYTIPIIDLLDRLLDSEYFSFLNHS